MYRGDKIESPIGFASEEEAIQWLHQPAEPKIRREHIREDGSVEEYYATREDTWCGPFPVTVLSPGPPHVGPRLRDALSPEHFGATGRISPEDSPATKCFLGSDWQIPRILRVALQRPGHWTEGRQFHSLLKPIANALGDLEDVLFEVHPVLSTNTLNAFWTSYQLSLWLQRYCEKVLAKESSAKAFAKKVLQDEPATDERYLAAGMINLDALVGTNEIELTTEPWLLPILEAMLVMQLHAFRYASTIFSQGPSHSDSDSRSEREQDGVGTNGRPGRDESATVERSTLWRIVASAMHRKNWSIEDLARQARLDRTTLYRTKSGSTSPHPKTVARLANALALTDEERHTLGL
jgi:hypothetical protein